MTLARVAEATASGARLEPICESLGVSLRTVQRWRAQDGGEDRRRGPHRAPPNKLSEQERSRLLEIANSPEHRDRSPRQIIPRLADEGTYIASESTLYRILREENQLRHRRRSRPPSSSRKPREHVATGPCQVWSWDITYLKGPVRGSFYYLYMILDVWSRKIVAARVEERECADLAAKLFEQACARHGVESSGLVLHSDNGSPMKGSTMLATLQRLGVVPSFSRPRVSDDNPYSESLFRTLKYHPTYPTEAFDALESARDWSERFVSWYNTEHLHSAIRFVTPQARQEGRETEILARRREVYTQARAQRPERWSGEVRDWSSIEKVFLNPEKSLN